VIITISGFPGSGKTTVGKMLAERLGYRFYSMGDLRGKMAMERGLTIDELNRLGESEAWTDEDADEYQRKLGKREDDFVMEGRLSFHFIPHSVKVFLAVDPGIGAERVFRNQRPDEERQESVEGVRKMLEERTESDRKRYRKYYGIDCFDRKHYDIVVDTTRLTKEQVVEKILSFIEKKV